MADMTKIKSVKNATLFHDKHGNPLIRVDAVRLSYAFIGNPSEDENDDGGTTKRWRTNALLPKETHAAAHKLIEEEINKLIAAAPKVDGKAAKVPKDKWFIKDGDETEDEHQQDHWVISAADPKNPPTARDRRGQQIIDRDEIDKMFYSGMWAHILIRPWYFGGKAKGSTKTFPKRVSAGLNGVLFYKDDTPFGMGRIDDSDAWGGAPEAEGGANGMDDDDEM